jgi:hypothetical protein
MAFKKRRKEVIRIYLNGGLGNQLFQFAFGVNLARTKSFNLVLDDSYLKHDPKRQFALDSFGLETNTLFDVSNEIQLRAFSFNPREYVFEDISECNFHYDEQRTKVTRKSSYSVKGYWQSHLYFEKSSSWINAYLSHSLPIIEKSNPYGVIHIRRGDFYGEKKTRKFHGLLDLEYYRRALQIFPEDLTEVYLISDSISSAKKFRNQLQSEFQRLNFQVYNQTQSEMDCLALMSKSSFLIMANSSFSWWGGFLGDSKRVISPRSYFAPETLRINNTCDLYPEGWFQV